MIASKAGHSECVTLLIANKADVNCQTDVSIFLSKYLINQLYCLFHCYAEAVNEISQS